MYPSLIDLCLGKIFDNFPRYNLAFTSTDYRKIDLEFLRKEFSSEMLCRFSVEERSVENYVDFLINKYLKTLDTSWFKNCSWKKVISIFTEIGCNIEEIYFQNVHFDEFCDGPLWHDIICYLPNLKNFTYQHDCYDLILQNVVKFCPDLEKIDLRNSKVKFETVKDLCENGNGEPFCTRLKKMWIANSTINDDDVVYMLKIFPSLEMIDFDDLPLYLASEIHLQCVGKVFNINTLNFMTSAFSLYLHSSARNSCFSLCPHLKFLTYGLMQPCQTEDFPELPELERLNIQRVVRFEINVSDIFKSKFVKLTSVTIGNCTVSVSVIAESCPSIKELNLDKVKILFDNNSKPVFYSLSSITFSNIDVVRNAKAMNLLLISSTQLESLTFEKCNLLYSEIEAYVMKYCEVHPLKKLSFLCSGIEKEYVKNILLICKTLNYLDIHGCFRRKDDENEILNYAKTVCSNKIQVNTRKDLNINKDYELEFFYNTYNTYDSDWGVDFYEIQLEPDF